MKLYFARVHSPFDMVDTMLESHEKVRGDVQTSEQYRRQRIYELLFVQ